VEQRWVLRYSAPRQPQAQCPVDKPWRTQSDKEVKAFQHLCGPTFACEADARQALVTFERDVPATFLDTSTVRALSRSGKRGRPRPGAQPDQGRSQIDGALASSLTARQARMDQQRCCILATNELDPAHLPPQAVLEGYKGQGHAERGFRFLKDPQFFASSLYRKKPERIMALRMVMTVCVLVYAAVEYRMRTALKAQDATFPDHKGQPVQNPTARWVFHSFVGIHVLRIPGQWDSIVVHLTEEHQALLRLLGKPYERWYRCLFTKMKGTVRNGG
jgi:transposase